MNTEGANQTQTQRGARQSQSQGDRTAKPEPQKALPQERADEEYPASDGPDSMECPGDPHPDSRPDSRRDQIVDPERGGGTRDRSQSI